jgi:hypothetical protein
MKRVIVSTLVSSAALAACATDSGPVCRAPEAHEMAAFAAVISHNENALVQALAPGATRDAFTNRDPSLRSYLWGANGDTRGSVVGLLSRPPLCILDDPAYPRNDSTRNILVYTQSSFEQNSATYAATTALPYGVIMSDYMACRFENSASGWKLADMCGYGGRTRSAEY